MANFYLPILCHNHVEELAIALRGHSGAFRKLPHTKLNGSLRFVVWILREAHPQFGGPESREKGFCGGGTSHLERHVEVYLLSLATTARRGRQSGGWFALRK